MASKSSHNYKTKGRIVILYASVLIYRGICRAMRNNFSLKYSKIGGYVVFQITRSVSLLFQYLTVTYSVLVQPYFIFGVIGISGVR